MPENAYPIMSYGMRNGSFSTSKHKLSDHISRTKCDYEHARQIVNDMESHLGIASLSRTYELLLRTSCKQSYSDCDVGLFV